MIFFIRRFTFNRIAFNYSENSGETLMIESSMSEILDRLSRE